MWNNFEQIRLRQNEKTNLSARHFQYVLTHNHTISKDVKIVRAPYKKKMTWTTVQYIGNLHKEFLTDFLRAAQLDDRLESSLPTFVFIIFTFILIHRTFHRRSNFIPVLQLLLYRVSLHY